MQHNQLVVGMHFSFALRQLSDLQEPTLGHFQEQKTKVSDNTHQLYWKYILLWCTSDNFFVQVVIYINILFEKYDLLSILN